MGCSHREGCPLFPLLNKSLRGWRDYYCDHEDGWRGCARYKLSLTGRPMPITLLPNGHDAKYITDRPGAAEPRQAPPSRLDSGSTETTGPIARFEPGPTPAPARPPEPSSQVPQTPWSPPARLTRPARRAHGSMRRWWTRLADWMTGPA